MNVVCRKEVDTVGIPVPDTIPVQKCIFVCRQLVELYNKYSEAEVILIKIVDKWRTH